MNSNEISDRHIKGSASPNHQYRSLFLRFCIISLVCSFVPLVFIATYFHRSYSDFSHARIKQSFQHKIESSQNLIQLFLKERLFDLMLISRLSSLEYLSNQFNLESTFEILNKGNEYFNDLGIINKNGFHISYVGPYDLMNNDYSITFWFKALNKNNTYVSDMFLGYRNVPHFIIAVLREEAERKWIVRATVDTQALSSVLGDTTFARTGEVFLLNSQGFYQTAPRSGGKILEKANLPMERFSKENGIEILDSDDPGAVGKIIAYAWLKNPRWLLVVQQDYAEFFEDVDYADRSTNSFLIVSAFSILAVVAGSTRYIIASIKRHDAQTETLNRQLIQAGKLASLGQLAAGVAHEINNPLAVIQSEIDLMREFGNSESFNRADSFDRVEGQIQRCSKITKDLLGFSRRIKTEIHQVDINQAIKEIVDLFEKWASSAGIVFVMDLGENLPKIPIEPFEIEQVLINLIGNAIHAQEGTNGGGTIRIKSFLSQGNQALNILIADDGVGIPAQHLDKIFDPFFTTKPQGKGTGLGLSISYSIVKHLGGEISVKSENNKGAEFRISLPTAITEGDNHGNAQSAFDRR